MASRSSRMAVPRWPSLVDDAGGVDQSRGGAVQGQGLIDQALHPLGGNGVGGQRQRPGQAQPDALPFAHARGVDLALVDGPFERFDRVRGEADAHEAAADAQQRHGPAPRCLQQPTARREESGHAFGVYLRAVALSVLVDAGRRQGVPPAGLVAGAPLRGGVAEVDQQVGGVHAHVGLVGLFPVAGRRGHLAQPELADAVQFALVARGQQSPEGLLGRQAAGSRAVGAPERCRPCGGRSRRPALRVPG